MNYSQQQRFSPAYLAFVQGLKKPVTPKQSCPSQPKQASTGQNQPSKQKPKRNNFQSFIDLRKNFRNAFASGVLKPGHFAPRIHAMVTAATNAILEDAKKRNINAILSELCKDGRLKPFSTAEALAFIWVYVGMMEAVTARNGPTPCTGGLNGQLVFLFKQAVSLDKKKNMLHVALLWKKVQKCHPPPSSEFHSYAQIFKNAYGREDLDMVPTPETRMEKLFLEISDKSGNPFSFLHEEDEGWEVDTPPVKEIPVASVKTEIKDKPNRPPVQQEIDTSFLKKPHQFRSDLQKISQKLVQDLTPKAIMKPSSSTFSSVHAQQKVAPVKVKSYRERDDGKSIKQGNVETASASKSGPSVQEVRKPSKKKKNLAPETMDNDFLLFLTNPREYIRLNPSLFPSSDATWSARKLLPDQPPKRKKPNPVNDPVPEPEVTQTPADCTETLLSVDFTPDEYVDQTTASNYYAQGVKIVDGVKRVVFYHKMINPSAIKKEPV